MPGYDRAVGALRALYDKRISTPPILDMDAFFPNAHLFLDAYPAIRREAFDVVSSLVHIPRFHDLMPQQAEGPPTRRQVAFMCRKTSSTSTRMCGDL